MGKEKLRCNLLAVRNYVKSYFLKRIITNRKRVSFKQNSIANVEINYKIQLLARTGLLFCVCRRIYGGGAGLKSWGFLLCLFAVGRFAFVFVLFLKWEGGRGPAKRVDRYK